NSFESPLRLSAAATRSAIRPRAIAVRRSAVLARREVAVVHGLLQEVLGLVLPELRDGRIGLHDRVPELAVLPLDLADVDVLDRVPVGIELHRTARRIGDLDLTQCLQELLAVLDVAPDGPGRLVDPARARVARLGEIRRDLAILLAVLGDEL